MSGDVIVLEFSIPSGKLTSAEGNLRVWTEIWWPDAMVWPMEDWKTAALHGVVMMVTLAPWAASWRPSSTMGIMWLVVKNGSRAR